MGEGSGVLFLEEYESARARGAKMYGMQYKFCDFSRDRNYN